MKTIFKQYIQVIGYSLVGLAFGFAFFYFFLNLYHYQELRRTVYIDFTTDATVSQLNQTLDTVQTNIQSFQPDHYLGTLEYSEAGLLQTKLNACVTSFRNETYQKIVSNNIVSIKDVYEFRESFDKNVLNGCIVKQLYGLVGENPVNRPFILQNQKLLKNYMDDLLQDTSYLKKDLYANSNYFFTTDMTALAVKNDVRDGFYEVMSSYIRAAKFLENISDWYKEEVGGVE